MGRELDRESTFFKQVTGTIACKANDCEEEASSPIQQEVFSSNAMCTEPSTNLKADTLGCHSTSYTADPTAPLLCKRLQ